MDQISAYAIPGVVKEAYGKWTPDVGERILRVLANHYQLVYEKLIGQNRNGEYVYVRQLYSYWLRTNVTFVSLHDIAKSLYQDHTTVIHNNTTFSNRLYTNDTLPKRLKTTAADIKADYKITSKIIDDAYRNLRKDR